MISRSTLLHCRFPFSFFLLPVYGLAVASVDHVDAGRSLLVFAVLHLFLYPASNGYNSYYDRDTGSIGGLRNPPPVTPDLLPVTLALNGFAVVLAAVVSPQFAIGSLMYAAASMLYSHPWVRVKRYPVAGWLYVGIGQGGLVFLLTAQSVGKAAPFVFLPVSPLPAAAAALLMLGVYPLTQIYQHRDDAVRGDRTMSMALGSLGTFHCAAVCMTGAIAGFMYYFYRLRGPVVAALFCAALVPAMVHLTRWYAACRRDERRADFGNLMRMNLYSSLGLVLFAGTVLVVRAMQ